MKKIILIGMIATTSTLYAQYYQMSNLQQMRLNQALASNSAIGGIGSKVNFKGILNSNGDTVKFSSEIKTTGLDVFVEKNTFSKDRTFHFSDFKTLLLDYPENADTLFLFKDDLCYAGPKGKISLFKSLKKKSTEDFTYMSLDQKDTIAYSADSIKARLKQNPETIKYTEEPKDNVLKYGLLWTGIIGTALGFANSWEKSTDHISGEETKTFSASPLLYIGGAAFISSFFIPRNPDYPLIEGVKIYNKNK
jgi:hypothetical protein